MTVAGRPSASGDLVDLRRHTSAAAAELDALALDGAELATLRRAIRLTRLTLECFWLPAIDAELAQHPAPETSDGDGR